MIYMIASNQVIRIKRTIDTASNQIKLRVATKSSDTYDSYQVIVRVYWERDDESSYLFI